MQVDVVRHLFTIAHCQQKSSVSKTSLVQSNQIITTKKEQPAKFDRKVQNWVINNQQTALFKAIPSFNVTIPACQFMGISISRYDLNIRTNKTKISPVSSLLYSQVRKNHSKKKR